MPNLTQLGNQRIEIIVRKEGGVSSQKNAKEKDADKIGGGSEDEKSSFWFGNASPERRKRIIKTNATHAVAVTKQVADLGLEYYISGLGYKHGDQAYQDNVSRRVEILKDVTNVASSIGMGAVYGAWGGPIGAALGATFGAISSGVSTAIKYASREREYNYTIFKEQNAIQYNRARAGINETNGRLR